MRAAIPVKEVRHIGTMGVFLNTLRSLEPGEFCALEKALCTIMPGVNCIDRWVLMNR